MPEYYVISSGEAETQLNTSLPEAAKDLESLGYVLRQRFEKYPRVLGFNIRRAALFPPVNWYLMPKVWIFKKADT